MVISSVISDPLVSRPHFPCLTIIIINSCILVHFRVIITLIMRPCVTTCIDKYSGYDFLCVVYKRIVSLQSGCVISNTKFQQRDIHRIRPPNYHEKACPMPIYILTFNILFWQWISEIVLVVGIWYLDICWNQYRIVLPNKSEYELISNLKLIVVNMHWFC